MADIRTVRRAAKKYGAQVTESELSTVIYVDAPPGKVWGCDFVHGLVGWYGETVGTKREACQDLLERMGYGLEDCNCAEHGVQCECYLGVDIAVPGC